MENKKNFNPTTLILVVLLVIVAFLVGSFWSKSNNLEGNKDQGKNLPQVTPTPQTAEPVLESTIGRFSVTDSEICQKDGKPAVYYFGYSGCPHCTWNHPILEKVVSNFGKEIVFYDGMDRLDKLTAEETTVFNQYQELHGGAVPFFALGCKYLRVGSGENAQEPDKGKASEEKNLTAILCKLTNGQPEKACSSVKDLVDQIK